MTTKASQRYSVTGATAEQVKSVGGKNITATRHCFIVFAELTQAQVMALESHGYTIKSLSDVKAADIKIADVIPSSISVVDDVITPPPIDDEPLYTPAQLMYELEFDKLRQLTEPPLEGEGINIAILDSGIRKTHETIGEDRIVYEHDYTGNNPTDVYDHGTGVAHILLTAVPKSNILNLKVLNNSGIGTVENLVLAIDDCITMHDEKSEFAPRIINLSLGVDDAGNIDDPIREICRTAIYNNIWIFAAAGNSGPNPKTILSPAVEQYVFAVGSCGFEPFVISEWSSRGPTQLELIKPDVVFLGERLRTASCVSDSSYTSKSGTSYSTPFVTGIFAMYQELVFVHEINRDPEYLFKPMELLDQIRIEPIIDEHLARFCIKPAFEQANKIKDESYGYGLPYGPLFIEVLESVYVPPADISKLIGSIIPIMMLSMIIGIFK